MGDEYSFLQETIKDEAGSVKTLRKKIFRNILCGIIFGVVACFTFFALKPWVKGIYGQDKTEVTIPEDEEILEEAREEEARKEETQKEQESERQKAAFLDKLQGVAKTSRRAVVTIIGQNAMEEKMQMKQMSGVIIADNGAELLILSSNLSEKKQNHMKVRFADGNEYPAALKKQDDNLGFGIYAVATESIRKETMNQIRIMELGNSRLAEKGDPTVLLSNSSEQGLDISYGILTDNEMEKEISDGTVGVLLADAAGAQYQGGIMVNQEGQLIGLIDETLHDNQLLISAYSISDIKSEIENLSNGEAVPYFGIRGTTLPEQLMEDGIESGIYVKEIDVDSPAMESGIQCGDVITHIDETEISDMDKYRRILLTKTVREEVILKGLRIGADSEYVEVEFHMIVGTK